MAQTDSPTGRYLCGGDELLRTLLLKVEPNLPNLFSKSLTLFSLRLGFFSFQTYCEMKGETD